MDVSPMTIFPEPGEAKDVAKLLLELADHPNQVMTTLDPGLGFKVPRWLYENFVTVWDDSRMNNEFIENLKKSVSAEEVAKLERFQAARQLSAEVFANTDNPTVLPMPEASLAKIQEHMEAVFGGAGAEVVQEAVKRKPGRPRKEVK